MVEVPQNEMVKILIKSLHLLMFIFVIQDTADKVKQSELTTDLSTTTLDVVADDTEEEFVPKFPRKYFNGIWLVIVFISVVVMVANAPEIEVILVAQVNVLL